jgi:hypothetical protein
MGLFVAWCYTSCLPHPATTLWRKPLPDGTILRLEQVTFGPNQKLVVQRGSHPLTNLLGVSPRPEISASAEFGEVFPQCGVWLTRRDPQTGEPLDMDWFSHCIAVDEQGWEHLSGFAGRCHWSKGSPTSPYQETLFRDKSPFTALPPGQYQEIVVGTFLPLFAPKDGRFPLHVYNTQGEVVATFDVPYPTAPPTRQDWTPVTLPATQSAGDLTVTLERLDWTPQPADASVPEKRLLTLKLQPQVAITWQGQPSDDWRFISENIMAVEDGLGNMSYMDRCRLTPTCPHGGWVGPFEGERYERTKNGSPHPSICRRRERDRSDRRRRRTESMSRKYADPKISVHDRGADGWGDPAHLRTRAWLESLGRASNGQR